MKLLTFLLLFTIKANDIVATGISCSNIPNDCKQLYLAITIKESGWHNSKNAIKKNNYSGFIRNGKLIKFSSIFHYITFSEKWFKRKHIRNENDLIILIKKGKYANLSKKELKIYLKDVLKIKKLIKHYYLNLKQDE
jgi:hypothetical protein